MNKEKLDRQKLDRDKITKNYKIINMMHGIGFVLALTSTICIVLAIASIIPSEFAFYIVLLSLYATILSYETIIKLLFDIKKIIIKDSMNPYESIIKDLKPYVKAKKARKQ